MPFDIADKIILFLEEELKNTTDEREIASRKEIIEYFRESKGQCYGLATFWLYGRRIADEIHDKKEPKPKDDIAFFNHVHKVLEKWNGTTTLSVKQKEDIYRFISHVLILQRFDRELVKDKKISDPLLAGNQLDVAELLEDDKHGKAIQKYRAMDLLSREMFSELIEKIVKPKNMILISFPVRDSGHAIAIYQNETDKKIYYYDSQNGEEIEVSNYEQFSQLVWSATNPHGTRRYFGLDRQQEELLTPPWERLQRKLIIQVLQFPDDPKYTYPKAEDLKISTEEFLDYIEQVQKYVDYVQLLPHLFLSRITKFDDDFRLFLDLLDDAQVLSLLQNSKNKWLLEILVLHSVVRSQYKSSYSPMLVRYIAQNYQLLLDTFQKQGLLTASVLSHFYELVRKPVTIKDKIYASYHTNHEEYISLNKSKLQEWLDLYKQGLITDNDKSALTLYNALSVLAVLLGDIHVANDLLDHCIKKDNTDPFIFGAMVNLLIYSNIQQGSIEVAKYILAKLAYGFNRSPSLYSVGLYENDEIINFMLDRMHDHYFDYSELREFITHFLTNFRNLSYEYKEAIEERLEKLKTIGYPINLPFRNVSQDEAKAILRLDVEGDMLIIPSQEQNKVEMLFVRNGKIETLSTSTSAKLILRMIDFLGPELAAGKKIYKRKEHGAPTEKESLASEFETNHSTKPPSLLELQSKEDKYPSIRLLPNYANARREEVKFFLQNKEEGAYVFIPAFVNDEVSLNEIGILYVKNGEVKNMVFSNYSENIVLRAVANDSDLIKAMPVPRTFQTETQVEIKEQSLPKPNLQNATTLFQVKHKTETKLEKELLTKFSSPLKKIDKFITAKYGESKNHNFVELFKLAKFVKVAIKEFATSMNYKIFSEHMKALREQLQSRYKKLINHYSEYQEFVKVVDAVDTIFSDLEKLSLPTKKTKKGS